MSHKHRQVPVSPASRESRENVAGGSVPDDADLHRMPSEHRRSLLPELYFRWRSGEITRLEAFCDVIFGFALTLLVVSLEVPRTYAQFIAAMRGFVPFAACFAQLVMIWRAHYKFSRRYGLEDPYTVFLNMVLLFLVLFYVYPLKFVFTLLFDEVTGHGVDIGFHEASVLMRTYAAGFAAVFALFALMYARAYKLRRDLDLNPVEAFETRLAMQENAISASIGGISLLLAFWNPGWAGWWFFTLGPALAIHGTIYGKRVRELAGKQDSHH
ncbi:MAG TPA: TMEM175 family protein [Verrucomicrobiae bacterium]|nr:TMEM175 family protein [Verrucomicrobiae bacterium]